MRDSARAESLAPKFAITVDDVQDLCGDSNSSSAASGGRRSTVNLIFRVVLSSRLWNFTGTKFFLIIFTMDFFSLLICAGVHNFELDTGDSTVRCRLFGVVGAPAFNCWAVHPEGFVTKRASSPRGLRHPEGFITQGALQSKSQTHSHTNKHTHTQTLKIPHSLHLETLQLYKIF